MALLWPIINAAVGNLGKVAVIDDHRRYTYKEILGGAMFLAEKIDSSTSAPNIGMLLPTSGTFPIALLAAWLARRVAVPFNYLLNKEELAYVIGDSEVDTIITVRPMMEYLADRAEIPKHVKLLYLEDVKFTGFPPVRWPPLVSDDDLAAILYTSGTSAKPKGVMLTHGNLHSNTDAAITHSGFTQTTTFLGVLPQFHSFGLTALTLLPLRAGCRVTYTARFVPKKFIELIRRDRPAVILGVPSMFGAMLSVKDAHADDFSSIRFAISGGEPLSQAVYKGFLDRFHVRLLEGYGLTETSPVLNWSTHQHSKRHAVGLAIPGVTIVIVDEQDKLLPAHAEGEILAVGPNIMKGYYKLPEQTEKVFVEIEIPNPSGGEPIKTKFLRTGDIGKLDDEGYLYITGRLKEMIKVAGEIVFPREVEEVLNHHPSVKDSAIIGKPDDVRGEVPVAYVEIKDGEHFDPIVLRSWCRDHLAGYKVPREVHKIDALPRNPTGKIMRRQLYVIHK